MDLADAVVLAGSGHRELAERIARELDATLGRSCVDRYADGEIHVTVGDEVRGQDVYIVQPTDPPVGERLLELMLVADACRRAGAERMSAVVPYLGFARHDRRAREGEPLGARVVADILSLGHFRRVIGVDLHTPALEGFFGPVLENLTAVPQLARSVRKYGVDAVVVSPDLGAVKVADAFSRALKLPVAIVHKTRAAGNGISVVGIAGEVRGRRPIVVDDIIATGATIAAACKALIAAGCANDITVVTTHAMLVGDAAERLASASIRRLVSTDTLPQRPVPFEHEVVGLAPLFADAIHRIRQGRGLGELVAGR